MTGPTEIKSAKSWEVAGRFGTGPESRQNTKRFSLTRSSHPQDHSFFPLYDQMKHVHHAKIRAMPRFRNLYSHEYLQSRISLSLFISHLTPNLRAMKKLRFGISHSQRLQRGFNADKSCSEAIGC